MAKDIYESPLNSRYASKEMKEIFSPDRKFKTWRKLWITLAEVEKELGLDITDEQIEELKAEVNRLKTFEDQQTEFQRIKTEFYEEVVYAENGPGADAYRKYYENMDPETAQYLYQEVVKKESVDASVTEYAAAYAAMDPKDAAEIFNTMGSSLELVGKILKAMNSAQRGAILGEMDPEMAAQVTRIMDPD